MKTDIQIVPEDEDEMEFLERLSQARSFALEEADMDESDVAQAFAQFAAGIFHEASPRPDSESLHKCPQCGQVVEDVETPGLSMDAVLVPCGCSVGTESLPEEFYLKDE